MLTFECLGCGELVETDNEDEYVSEVCDMCQEYGTSYAIDRGDYVEVEYCNCEDFPCCGHGNE